MLEKIQSSLLVFCLDDDRPHATPEDYSQVFSYLVQLFLSLFFFLRIHLSLAVLGLCCFAWAFSPVVGGGVYSPVVERGLLTAVASRWGAQAVGAWASVATTYGPDLCPLCWQVDS